MSVPGYHSKYMYIDLSRDAGDSIGQSITLPESALRQFIGGSGLGAYLLLKHQGQARAMHGATRPSETGPLAFVFSPLVGSPLTTSAKFAVVCKSPLTHRFNDALASSGFAISGKATGHDAIVIAGKAASLSVIVIDDGDVRIESATDLAGQTTTATERRLRERFGSSFDFAVIGPAGEQQVRYASVSHDGRHAGRGGSGAVLGEKNVKAVAVRGSKRCEWYDSTALAKYARELSQLSMGAATAKYRELGTASNLLAFNRLHTLPTRNFQQSEFEGAQQLAPETLEQSRQKSRSSCRACTIGCEHLYQLEGSKKKVRLEYENLFALGPLCGIDDATAVLQASQRCDELGIDTISTGGTIAFAMECVQRKLLDESWLQFGDAGALLRAIELIGSRDGIGELLAGGSRAMAATLGGDALNFAPHVKGLEIPGYEPRTLQTMALGFAVSTRGADHNRSSAYEVDFSDAVDRRNVPDEAVAMAIATEDKAALLDSMILCKFLRGVFDDIWDASAEMLQMVTGWDVTTGELQLAAKNIISAKKRFNVLAGWHPDEDTLPNRFFDEALPDDHARLSRNRLQTLVGQYNLQRGWSKDGYPSGC